MMPVMRVQRSGTIVNLNSLLGRIAFVISAMYTSTNTKFTLEGLSESMRYEVEEFGINARLIEPCAIRTNFRN